MKGLEVVIIYGGTQLTTFAQTTPTPHPHHTNTTPTPHPHHTHTHTTPTPNFLKKVVVWVHTTTFFKKCGVGVVWVWFGRRLSVVCHRNYTRGVLLHQNKG